MRIGFNWLARVAALVLAAAALPAHGQEHGTAAVDQYMQAADELDRLAGAAASANAPPPRMSDAHVAELFARMAEAPRTFNQSGDQIDLLLVRQVLGRQLGFFSLYASWGGNGPNRTVDAQDRNVVIFQDEIEPIVGVLVDLTAIVMRNVAPGASSATADRVPALVSARTNLNEIVGGVMGMIRMQGVSPQHKLAFAQALDRNSADIAAAMSLSQRRGMAVRLQAIRETAGPQLRQAIDQMLVAFSSSACTGLCAI